MELLLKIDLVNLREYIGKSRWKFITVFPKCLIAFLKTLQRF